MDKETRLLVEGLEKEIEGLREEVAWLRCLEAAGVDNWEGIDYAHELLQEELEND